MADKPTLILASGSRFRRQMLENAGLDFDVEPATLDEVAARAEMARRPVAPGPAEVAVELAAMKALEVSERHPRALVIGCDQVLDFEGRIYGKPSDVATARAQLIMMSGHTHALPTGLVLVRHGRVVFEHLGEARLTMRALSETFLDDYLARVGDAATETAGGYALEGLGVQLFERVDGDYFTIIGLPLLALLAELRRRGVVAA